MPLLVGHLQYLLLVPHQLFSSSAIELIPMLVELDNLSLKGHLHIERPFVGVDCPQLLGQLLLLQTFFHDIKVVLDRFLLMGDGGILLCLV